MSAYLCADDTFDYLTTALEQWGTVYDKLPDPQQLAQLLRFENLRSIVHLYGEKARGDDDGDYTFRRVPVLRIDPVVVLKSITCLDYQSCETDNWDKTEAYRILQVLTRLAIARLPGYETAPWGWTRDSQAPGDVQLPTAGPDVDNIPF